MARLPRPQFEGAIYHAFVHTVGNERFFRRASDREILFWLLDGVVADYS